MATRKTKKANTAITQLFIASAAGATYAIAYEVAAKGFEPLGKNYYAWRGGIASVVGSLMAYMSKNPNVQAAGLGLAGLGGRMMGSAIANKMPMNGTNRVPMNGTNRVPMNGLKEAIQRRRAISSAMNGTNSVSPAPGYGLRSFEYIYLN